ncbi:5'-3' exonuclease [Streptomyces qinzhouensis]|uniref:5'-3' exonuclease n=1 Tax=Streptomyces qinzhouensis TaxID=2599401 RepID=A0A5B8IB92_9ACTN|nr:5'-3' exonuclease H3TH domain-containing protein [Streptomyces qinzhouensis]QDY75338.1 flap endonuclease [Streptomyces qinzhouensis]
MTVPLLLVDGHNLLHRAWFGFAARIWNRDKTVDRTGVFGFAALLRKAQAQHATGFEVFTVFDAENGSQTRLEQDPAYKGQRPAPDPGLMDSLPLVKAALDHAGVRWIEQDGCEADDVIATLTTRARAAGRPVDIMSADKDYIQLLCGGEAAVRLLNTGLGLDRRYTIAEHIYPRYGVHPAQWADYRALTGDPADNIAGLRGVGPKTAARLLADGRHLGAIPVAELRPAWTTGWPAVLRWREMIRLDTKTDLPDELLAGLPTPPLPKAPDVLEAMNLW